MKMRRVWTARRRSPVGPSVWSASMWMLAAAIVSGPSHPVRAQQSTAAQPKLSPAEIQATLQASRVVLGTQAAERREAEALGLSALGSELQELQEKIATRASSGRAKEPEGDAGDIDPSEAVPPETASRADQLRGALADIDSRVAETIARLATVQSPRQRAIAKELLQRAAAVRAMTQGEIADAESAAGEPESMLTLSPPRVVDTHAATPQQRMPEPTFRKDTPKQRRAPELGRAPRR